MWAFLLPLLYRFSVAQDHYNAELDISNGMRRQ